MKKPKPRVVATREAVFAECDRLFASNQRITAAAIQKTLGGGSPNVVYRHMDEWHAQHRQRFLDLQVAVGRPCPAGLPATLWEAITPAWEALTQAAVTTVNSALRAQFRSERDALAAQLGAINVAVVNAGDRLAQINAKGGCTPKALAGATDTIRELQQHLATARNALERHAQDLNDGA